MKNPTILITSSTLLVNDIHSEPIEKCLLVVLYKNQ